MLRTCCRVRVVGLPGGNASGGCAVWWGAVVPPGRPRCISWEVASWAWATLGESPICGRLGRLGSSVSFSPCRRVVGSPPCGCVVVPVPVVPPWGCTLGLGGMPPPSAENQLGQVLQAGDQRGRVREDAAGPL